MGPGSDRHARGAWSAKLHIDASLRSPRHPSCVQQHASQGGNGEGQTGISTHALTLNGNQPIVSQYLCDGHCQRNGCWAGQGRARQGKAGRGSVF